MVMRNRRYLFAGLFLLIAGGVGAAEEVSLFDSKGSASAYIETDQDKTIYLWSGEPVAYLTLDSGHDFHVYGFSGTHLGWFVGGVLRNNVGYAVCADEHAMPVHELEPLKSLKSLTPLKSLEELSPLRPLFTNTWARTSCSMFLQSGTR
jgi:hypothetical protein